MLVLLILYCITKIKRIFYLIDSYQVTIIYLKYVLNINF